MSQLEKFIANEPEERVETVKFQGSEFVLRGSPDAKYWANAFLIEETDKSKLAHHWTVSNGWKQAFETKMVSDVKLVAMVLQKDESDPDSRYDEMDIAQLCVKNAKLFISLYTAALKVTGIADSSEVIEEVAGKSSEGSGDTDTE